MTPQFYFEQFNFDLVPEDLRSHAKQQLQSYIESALTNEFELITDPAFIKNAPRVFAISDFIADSAKRYPNLIKELFEENLIQRTLTKKDYQAIFQQQLSHIENIDDLMRCLRLLRRKHLVRIIWQDLIAEKTPWELMQDWSDFADSCVEFGLSWLSKQAEKKYGLPKNSRGETQELCVIALGKLGGQELNWSSDIDLIFAYEEDGETENQLSYAQFFSRLAQDLVKLLNQVTMEGFVFRVDLRLRPHGASGGLVMPLNAMQNYYENSAREWERYALIRARIITGNLSAVNAIKKIITAFVYKAELDYSTLEPLRELQKKIDLENRINDTEQDIKRGAGGIRQIEFILQTQQLISGGEYRLLRSNSINQVFNALQDEQLMDSRKINDLKQAYIFLRRTEHIIQGINDRQLHDLPEDPLYQKKLSYALNFSNYSAFMNFLDTHREIVKNYYQDLLAKPSFETLNTIYYPKKDLTAFWTDPKTIQPGFSDDYGFQDKAAVQTMLQTLQQQLNLNNKQREQINILMPILLNSIVNQTDNPDITLARIIGIIQLVAKKNIFLSLLIENPKALSQLIRLCSMSPWISNLLQNYPQLLGQLIDNKRLYAPLDLHTLQKNLSRLMKIHADESLENKIELVAKFKLVNILRVAAMDISGILPMMRVSDHLTNLATVILDTLCDLAIQKTKNELQIKAESHLLKAAFIVLAYGKLGGIELGYSSDLDLIFLYDTVLADEIGQLFFTQVARQIMVFNQTLTKSGKLYPLDLRLRPQGESGLLVNSMDAFEHYQEKSAWIWEHQALVRARALIASKVMTERFNQLRQKIIFREQQPDILKNEIVAMREKMRANNPTIAENLFDIKYGFGGIVDIEFFVQYIALAYARAYPQLIEFTDNIRILERMFYCEILTPAEVHLLSDAYRAYRSTVHRLDLLHEKAIVPLGQFSDYRKGVIEIWNKYLLSNA